MEVTARQMRIARSILLPNVFILVQAVTAFASPSISISTDAKDCVNGWISMDVSVTVDGQTFNFDPSCKFSFDQTFKTKSGLECKVAAGMCSSFSPKNSFEATCGSTTESVSIACPAN